MFDKEVLNEYNDVKNYQDLRLFTAGKVATDEPLYDFQDVRQNWTKPSRGNLPNVPNSTVNCFNFFDYRSMITCIVLII